MADHQPPPLPPHSPPLPPPLRSDRTGSPPTVRVSSKIAHGGADDGLLLSLLLIRLDDCLLRRRREPHHAAAGIKVLMFIYLFRSVFIEYKDLNARVDSTRLRIMRGSWRTVLY